MKLKGGILVTAKDIAAIKGRSQRTGERELRRIREALDKIGMDITIYDCAKYWQVDVDILIDFLNEKRSI